MKLFRKDSSHLFNKRWKSKPYLLIHNKFIDFRLILQLVESCWITDKVIYNIKYRDCMTFCAGDVKANI